MNEDLLSRSVEELQISVRATNSLKNENIRTIGELVQRTRGDLLRTPNLGRKSLAEIEAVLRELGLKLRDDG